jgi:hypothetical protein
MTRRESRQRQLERQKAIEDEAINREVSSAQSAGVQSAHHEGPAIDLLESLEGTELWDRLTDLGLESAEYQAIEEILRPHLTASEMLASHDSDYYSIRAQKLLNENLADRILAGRTYPELCTGEFREIAQEVDGDLSGGLRKDLSQPEREAIRTGVEEVKTDRASLGDGTFLSAIMEMHVSSEVKRSDEEASKSKSGLLSLIPGIR